MIKLEYLLPEDYKNIVKWNKGKSQDFLYQWAGPWYKFPITEIQLAERFQNKANRFESDVFVFKIVMSESNEMIGTIELFKIDRENKTATAGKFLIDENKRGLGIGKLALEQLVKIGFNELRLNTIKLNVFDFNVRAIRCYESVGFVKTTFTEKVWEADEGFWNCVGMEISR